MSEFIESTFENKREPSKYENDSPYPRTLEDFRLRAAELEQERDMVRAALIDEGYEPKDLPQYAHLLGRLGAVHEQIRAMESEQLEQQFKQ